MPMLSKFFRWASKTRYLSIVTLLVTMFSFSSSANDQSEAEENYNSSQIEQITSRVESYVDKYIPDFIDKNHTPGAAFILVDKNGPLLIKGYGKHSFKNGVAIDPDKHLFRIASITKTMTGLGIMKLVNEGNVNKHQCSFHWQSKTQSYCY